MLPCVRNQASHCGIYGYREEHLLIHPMVAILLLLGGMVAQFRLTVVCTLDGPMRLTTSGHALPFVHSTLGLDAQPELAALVQSPVVEAKKEALLLEAASTAEAVMDMDL